MIETSREIRAVTVSTVRRLVESHGLSRLVGRAGKDVQAAGPFIVEIALSDEIFMLSVRAVGAVVAGSVLDSVVTAALAASGAAWVTVAERG
jgi:hypothetical protein